MSFESEIEKSIEDGFIKQIADKILQEIAEVSNKPDVASRRWVWELLQNAKDVPNVFGGVSVRIDLTADSLKFSHNGNPFTIDNLTHLIQQVSSKFSITDSDEKTTGKYGTGFIATHTLSKIIRVSSYVRNNEGVIKKFSFDLDRSTSDQKEMMIKIRENLELLKKLSDNSLYPIDYSFINRSESLMTTQFSYTLSDKSKDYALAGLDDLNHSLPVTLCVLRNKIRSVEVHDNIRNRHRIYKVTNSFYPDGVIQFEVTRTDLLNSLNTKIQHVIASEEDGVFVSLALVKNENGAFRLKKRADDSSVLFKEFPLIGSQDFYFPAFIQSSQFEPTKDRDGIFLKEDDQEIVITNRLQIEKALGLYKRFFSFDKVLSWGDLHLLANSRFPNNKQGYISEEWYTNDIQIKLREFLLDQPLVLVEDKSEGDYKSIKKSKFPFIPDSAERTQKFWEICSYAFGTQIPNREFQSAWITIIVPEYETWKYSLKFTLSDLLLWIQNCGTLAVLSESLKEIDSVDWLNSIIKFLCDNDYKSELEKYTIIPNQNHELKFLKDVVYDKELPTVLVDILKEISIDWRSTLIHKRIHRIEGHHEFTVPDISSKINEAIISFSKKSSEELNKIESEEPGKINTIRKGILHLSSCITSEESINRKKIFEFARLILPNDAPEDYQLVPNTSLFNWEPVNRFVLSLILHTISEFQTLPALSQFLNQSDSETLQILDDLHKFLASSKEHEPLLTIYKTLPNQYNEFCQFNDLFKDVDNIPDELKEILKGLDINQDWKSILLNEAITLSLSKEKKLDEICNIIDNIVIDRRSSNTLTDTPTKKQVLNLIQIITGSGKKYENFLKFTYLNKANLFMDMFENTSLKESLFRIMQDENLVKNLDTIASLKLSNEQLDKLASAINQVGIDKVLAQVAELVEKETYFHDMKVLGDLAEEAFRKSFEALGLEVKIHATEGACDFLIIKPDSAEYSVEVKSCTIEKPYISMYPSQAQKAVLNPTKFALCVLERNIANPTLDYFRTHVRFVIDIGIILADKQKRASEYGEYMNNIRQEYVTIDYENPTYKFIVKRPLWENKLSFWQFVDYIKTSFIQ